MSSITITNGKIWSDDISSVAKVSIIPQTGNFKSVGNNFIEKVNPFAYVNNDIMLKKGFFCDLYDGTSWMEIGADSDFTFTPSSCLDAGNSLTYGKDYYIYLCVSSNTPQIIVSLNATYPDGFSAYSSRKIGGFHYGAIREVSDDDEWVPIDSAGTKFGSGTTIWKNNVTSGIIPNSVWDLKNRPKTFMPGLAKVGNIWVSIYQMSVDETVTFMSSTNNLHVANGSLKSSYGSLPATGTEGLSQYNFNELAHRQGMRLSRYEEFLAYAYGSPQGTDTGNDYGWTATANTARTYTGCGVLTSSGAYSSSGIKPYAVSAYNIVDCVGNVWEWQSDYYSQDDKTVSWTWKDTLGSGMGQIFESSANSLRNFVCGGSWNGGVHYGARSVDWGNCPWNVSTQIGCRFACDAN